MAELDSRSPRGEDFSRADLFPEDYPTEEAPPRSGSPRPAGGSHSARPAPPRKRRTPPPARNSGRGWRRFLLIYTLLFLLAGAAGEMDDPVRRRVLEQLLYHLGRWIYLVDAADDLKQDAREGNYNPVALRYGLTGGVWTPESRHEFAQTLDHSIHTMAADFELLDFGCWRRILESTLYTGLFYVGGAVLDGTFQSAVRNRKKHKNVEEAT